MDTKIKIARIISEIINGFAGMLIPVILVAWISPILIWQKILITVYYLIATISPFYILKALKKISDYELTDRKERPPYFITITTLFLIGFIYTYTLGIEQIYLVTLSLFTTTFVLTIVNMFWKMSGHMTHGTFELMTLIYLFPEIKYLWLILLYLPLLAWSRVQLKKHTWWQTVVGTTVSLTLTILFYYILW
jgi:hypothetical protein